MQFLSAPVFTIKISSFSYFKLQFKFKACKHFDLKKWCWSLFQRIPTYIFMIIQDSYLRCCSAIGQKKCKLSKFCCAILRWYIPKSHWDFELFSSSNHISPLLNHPQGCQGCQKNRKDLRFHTQVRFCANIQPKLNELQKYLQIQQKSSKYAGFLVLF